MSFSYTNFQKSPYRGRGKTPLPPLGRLAPSLWPPMTNPGCTTVTGIARMHKGAMPPTLDWRVKKEKKKRGKKKNKSKKLVYATT